MAGSAVAGLGNGRLAPEPGTWLPQDHADLPRDAFTERLTYYLGEVNAVHPFREGNGRAQRAFFEQLASDAGFVLDWQHLDADRNIAASAAIMHGDPGPDADDARRTPPRAVSPAGARKFTTQKRNQPCAPQPRTGGLTSLPAVCNDALLRETGTLYCGKQVLNDAGNGYCHLCE
jgi:hypothetical protein